MTGGVDWCGQCGSRAATFSPGELVGELNETWSPYVPKAVAPDEPRPIWRMSRLRGGATTLGGRGRLAVTILIASAWLTPLILLVMTTVGTLLAYAYAILTLPGVVLVLTDVWRSESVVEAPPAATECGTCGAPRRQGGLACHVCFAAYEAKHVPVYSRTSSGPTSFGVAGRWLLTLGLFVAYFTGAIFAALLGPATILVYSGAFAILCVKLLPAIWARTRVS